MGLITGVYDAKEAGGFVPGGAVLHNCMSGHGPDRARYEKPRRRRAQARTSSTTRWPSCSRPAYAFEPTAHAMASPVRDAATTDGLGRLCEGAPARREGPAMKLASLKGPGRDGTLVVVSRDLARAVEAKAAAPTMQAALEDWEAAAPALAGIARGLERGEAAGVFDFAAALAAGRVAAPLPAPTSGSTARPISRTWSGCGGRAATRCPKASTATR